MSSFTAESNKKLVLSISNPYHCQYQQFHYNSITPSTKLFATQRWNAFSNLLLLLRSTLFYSALLCVIPYMCMTFSAHTRYTLTGSRIAVLYHQLRCTLHDIPPTPSGLVNDTIRECSQPETDFRTNRRFSPCPASVHEPVQHCPNVTLQFKSRRFYFGHFSTRYCWLGLFLSVLVR